jgi:ferredoxin-NADP reductase
VNVRLPPGTGDGAVRTFSIASAPEDRLIALTIERFPGGKVSSHLCGGVDPGFRFELRGPMGRSFVWRPSDGGPLLLVAGGSGMAPLMSMLRHRAHVRRAAGAPGSGMLAGARVLYSTRNSDDVIYRDELKALVESDPSVEITHTATRNASADWPGFRRRIDRAMLEQVAWPPTARPRNYVCGPTELVEAVVDILVGLGHDRASIFTERFGPTGGSMSDRRHQQGR